jgi:hypothetical protein
MSEAQAQTVSIGASVILVHEDVVAANGEPILPEAFRSH